jgi:two-component sensor histidine kinase
MTLYNYDDSSFRLFDKDNGLLYDFVRFFNFTNNTYFSAHNNTVQYSSFDKLVSLSNQRVSFINRLVVYSQKTILFPDFSNNKIELDYKHNTIEVSFSAIEHLFPEKVQYAFRLSDLDNVWKFSDYKSRQIIYSNLSPGKYIFELKAQMLGGNWQEEPIELFITITPPFWQTWWFRILAGLFLVGIIFYFVRWRIAGVRKKEQQKAMHQKELLELEAKALRAQMNPHFIFNSMNSIKSLINKNENDIAANYLTTFSKLIRTLFQNSDKREVSLYEELETCKFYTQLEKMRFADKVEFVFDIDETIDLKDFKVPALILQPFIENAIWHGLIPKETGGKVTINVTKNNGTIQCVIDDNGIGREQSKQFKPQYEATYQSKGIGLTQSRLELDKLLNEREDSISIIDKKNELGKSEGTKVIISFKENKN